MSKREEAIEYCKVYNLPYIVNDKNVLCVNSNQVHHTYIVKLAKIYDREE